MTEALPKGIVLHTARISSEIENFGGIDAEDLAKLWRVYTTNRSTLKEDEGRRLENLFWRIWSNQSIFRSLQGTTLARLFLHIAEGESITRLSPRRLREVSQSTPRISSRRQTPASSTKCLQPQSPTRKTTLRNSLRVSRKSSGPASRAPLPPPILKKSRQVFDESQKMPKTSVINSTEVGTSHNSPTSPSLIVGHESPMGESASERPQRKKTTFATNLTTREVEPVPVTVRKKSPSPTSALVDSRYSPSASSPRPIQDSDFYGPPASKEQEILLPDSSAVSISPTPTYTNPHPWLGLAMQRRGPTSNSTTHPTATVPSKYRHEQWAQLQKCSNRSSTAQDVQPSGVTLVDKNFRARFVEKRSQKSRTPSFTNVGSLLSMKGENKENTITTAMSRNMDPSHSQDCQSPGIVNAIDFNIVGNGGVISEGKSHTQQPPLLDKYSTKEDDEDDIDGEWEDIDSMDGLGETDSSQPSQQQPQAPFPKSGTRC
ncbi:hypothetical protein ACO22_04636 [Paracoccidioides brasiliensis]|uniref:Nitrogen regulatory protein areA GATA-like domain-containing protein n=1 Tax=Paracoccidioides brasiliensis TaxID=121759 RepID=A0A1D2JCL5_PARBR|nr:hypothetical protein ACO22_04636 [Paracoccidioides brasiliensis]